MVCRETRAAFFAAQIARDAYVRVRQFIYPRCVRIFDEKFALARLFEFSNAPRLALVFDLLLAPKARGSAVSLRNASAYSPLTDPVLIFLVMRPPTTGVFVCKLRNTRSDTESEKDDRILILKTEQMPFEHQAKNGQLF